MALSQQEKDVKDLVDEVKTLYTERQNLLSPDERNAGWNEGNLTPRQLLYIQELLQSGVFEQATLNDVAKAVGYSPESFSQTLSGARQQALEMDTPQETTGMALPEELTNIPIDNNYSMDEAAIVEQLISSGRLSVPQVSDYFGLPAADINRVLAQDFGYTPEQATQAQSTIGDLSGVAPTAVQTGLQVSDVDAVENLISTGQASVGDVAKYFNTPEETVIQHLTEVRGYTPEGIQSAIAGQSVAPENRFASYQSIFGNDNIMGVSDPSGSTISGEVQRQKMSPEQLQAEAANILNKAQSPSEIAQGMRNLTGFASNPSGEVLAAITAVSGVPASAGLTQDAAWSNFEFRPTMRPYFNAQGQTAGGPQLVSGRSAEATIAENMDRDTGTAGGDATNTGTAGGATQNNLESVVDGATTGGLTGQTSAGTAAQNVFSPIGGQAAIGNQFTFPTGGANMPQTGVIGAEAALQGGLAGGLAGLQQGIGEARTGLVGSSQEAINQLQSGLATGATGLTQATAAGLRELRGALGQGRKDISTGFGRAEQGFQPYMQGGQAAQAQLEALSGVRGQDAFNQAYQESPQMAFLREQGMRANLAGAAATGGLGGGNVQKELARFGQGLASQGLQQQIQNLQGLTGQGLQAASGAGQYASGGAGQLANLSQLQGTQSLGAMQNVGQGLAGLGQVAGTQGAGIMQNVGNQLANLGLAGGQTAAQMGYGTGQNLADIRTRAGELMAGEISNVSRDVSGLASALGGDISGVYGAQSKNLADLLVQSGMAQADATRISAQLLSNIATGASGQVAGLGTSVGQPQQNQGILGQVGQLAGGVGTAATAGKDLGLFG